MLVVHMAQSDSQPPIEVHVSPPSIDFSGLAAAIWQFFVDHISDLGNAIWSNLLPRLPDIAGQVVGMLEDALQHAAEAIWDATWSSSANIVTQVIACRSFAKPARSRCVAAASVCCCVSPANCHPWTTLERD